ncbi:chemotaxis protein CheW [Roseiconus lacunae]|uniref:Chemotaxis protein CheW n=1 Tax=Roseiconus lacunae TaxID=2605694 RepID=A0ABT7PLU9_9BACT|nr:chemotaxis protein CheW [Roseiconus lacunae]MCD0460982.1 chemotaxis protein CheW [Roseiconus lacunae]MDM4017261.1 chemotaxis protein CheW [Roseiconus lacunae]WRQ48822.1 chemotaxis protein CheW [Stieleria sp. HD01]
MTTTEEVEPISDAADVVQMTDLSTDGNQFLTFTLQDEEFGIEILRVQEIKGLSRITPIPNMPFHIRGVMNLRGTVVPIIDLRAKFAMPEVDYNQFTVIIVVTIGDKVIGLVVDAVSDVLNVAEENIESAPDLGGQADTTFMTGIAKSGDRLITLLNMDDLIGAETVSI